MKVVVCGPDWVAKTTEAVVAGWQQTGAEVRKVYWEYFYTFAGVRRLGSYVRTRFPQLTQNICYRTNHKRLMAAVADGCDLVMVIIGTNVHADTIREIKERYRVPVCIWLMDDPFICWSNPPVIRENMLCSYRHYDYIFVFDSFYLDGVCSHFGDKTYHLPLAYDPDVFMPQAQEKKYDVSFIGVAFPNRCEYFRCLEGITVDTWGGGFDRLPNCRCHSTIAPADANTIYSQSRINVNINHRQSIRGSNTRVFEVAGSGNFILTEYKCELKEQFQLGREIETFKTAEEFKEKINHYLAHPDAAADIAAAGAERAKKCHTNYHRMRQVRDITGFGLER